MKLPKHKLDQLDWYEKNTNAVSGTMYDVYTLHWKERERLIWFGLFLKRWIPEKTILKFKRSERSATEGDIPGLDKEELKYWRMYWESEESLELKLQLTEWNDEVSTNDIENQIEDILKTNE